MPKMVNSSELTAYQLTQELLINVLPVTIFIGVEAVIGFFGNILILYVYYKWYVHCNFRYFVLFLAIYDLTSCLTTLPGEIFSQCNWFDYKYGWICKTKSYFNVFTAWGSAFTLLTLAFDRYRKICRPLAWQIQPSFALKLCACGIVLSSLVSIPITILWGKQTYIYEMDGGVRLNVSICEKSQSYANDVYPFIYISCVYILPIGLMMTAVCVCNILIARKLFCKLYKNDKNMCRRGNIVRNYSQSSDVPRPSSVSYGIRKMLCYTASLMATRTVQEGARQLRSVQENRILALSTVSLQEISTERPFPVDTIETTHRSNAPRRLESESSDSYATGSEIGVRERISEGGPFRRKPKTFIMLVLTSVFILTMVLYIALLSLVAKTNNILRELSNTKRVVFFFFWRSYFINCVINPLLYGVMDPRFRKGLKRIFCACKKQSG